MLYRLSATRQLVNILESFLPEGYENPPALSDLGKQALLYDWLGVALDLVGRPGNALIIYKLGISKNEELLRDAQVAEALGNLSDANLHMGRIYDSELSALRAILLNLNRKNDAVSRAVNMQYLGLCRAIRGEISQAKQLLEEARNLALTRDAQQAGVACAYLAQVLFWDNWPEGKERVESLIREAESISKYLGYERDIIRCSRLYGAMYLRLDQRDKAETYLSNALKRARAVNYVREELLALIDLASLRLSEGKPAAALELLDESWEIAETGPYPLLLSDAWNVVARSRLALGERNSAIEAAIQACRYAWCDGPPFSYHWGLEAGLAFLRQIGSSDFTGSEAFNTAGRELLPVLPPNFYNLPNPADLEPNK
jgi:tetratricopeptide (TPR) repeat protein